MTAPIIEGGQGRTPEDVGNTARGISWALLFTAAGLVMAWLVARLFQ